MIRARPLEERVRAALRREGTASAPKIALGIGARQNSVHNILLRGVASGWCREAGRDGRAVAYALSSRTGAT